MSINPVDRELLKRIYTKHKPEKLNSIEEILDKRKNSPQEMQDMYAYLDKSFNLNIKQMRAQVEKDLGVSSSPAASPQKKPQAAASPSSPAGGGAASGDVEQQTIVRVRRLLLVGDPDKAGNAEALVKSLTGGKPGLTQKTADQLVKQLEKRIGVAEADLDKENASSGAAQQQQVSAKPTKKGAKTAGNDDAAANAAGSNTSNAAVVTDPRSLVEFSKMWGTFYVGPNGSGGLSSNTDIVATSSSKLKPVLIRLIHDSFGLLPENQRPALVRRGTLTKEERNYYEQLLRPSVTMACMSNRDDDIVDEAMQELFTRAEVATLTPQMAEECTTTKDVCDRILKALQSKYEHRNPAGKSDFFGKFLPASSPPPAAMKQKSTREGNNNNNSELSTFISPNSNPMLMSRMIAQNTLASSMISSSSFLGVTDDRNGGGGAQQQRLEGGPGYGPDLGPLPGDGSDGDKNNRSFSTLLTSAMKFLHSSSIETMTPHSDKELLTAVFVIECLDWNDVVVATSSSKNQTNNNNSSKNNNNENNNSNDDTAKASSDEAQLLQRQQARRLELFKTALAQDIAEILGWGELLEHSGKHNWRNVAVRQFSLSMAGNVHADVEIVIPAGISVDDLKSLVINRLRAGGFTLPRARVSLARDLDARPAKLFCRSASFDSGTQPHRDAMVPETVYDERLGVHISPHHRNAAASGVDTSQMSMPVQGVERGGSEFYL